MQSDKTNTPNEIIDLVNENDEVIGTTTKGEANNNPKLIHREVAIIIFDKNNKILFQQRSRKKVVSPLVWVESCAGHIPSGMDIQEAAQRELKEELGLSIPLQFLIKEFLIFPNETHMTYWFVAKYNEEPITIEPEEVEQIKFLSRTEMQDMIKKGTKFGTYTLNMVERFWNNEFKSLMQ